MGQYAERHIELSALIDPWIVIRVLVTNFLTNPIHDFSFTPSVKRQLAQKKQQNKTYGMSKFAPHRHAANNPRATSSTICQKCLRTGSFLQHVPCLMARRTLSVPNCITHTGHFTYECKSNRPYVSRPSRTAQLQNPRLAKAKAEGKPSVEVPEEFKNKFRVLFLSLNPAKTFKFLTDFLCMWNRVFRSGTANRILEAKEKQREREGSEERAKKRAKRYAPTLVPAVLSYEFALMNNVSATRSSSRASASSRSNTGGSSESDSSSDTGSDAESESSGSSRNSYTSRSRSRERDDKRRRPRGRSVSSALSHGRWNRERSRSPTR
jgi:Zinc knuckle